MHRACRRGRLTWTLGGVAGLLMAMGAVHAARVIEITPRGEAPQVRQVRVLFASPMAPLGEARAPDPAVVSCQPTTPAGAGRWEDARTRVFDFRDELPPGMRCEVRLKPDAAKGSASGVATPPEGPQSARFSTGGPAVAQVLPWPGSEIEEDQHFLLQLTGAATPASIEAHAACEIEGLGDRLPVRLVTGQAREAVLKAQGWARYAERAVVLACTRALPGAAKVRLVWGRGIASATDSQVRTRTEQAFGWRVRPAFSAEFSCERERAQAPCLPIRPLTVRFSAPVPRALAAQVRLSPKAAATAGAAGATGAASGAAAAGARGPDLPRGEPTDMLSEVSFAPPFAEQGAYVLTLPAGLRDQTGRALANGASFPLEVRTGEAPPLAKFAAAPFGVVERLADPQAGPLLPVTLRHVQAELRMGPSAKGSATAAGAGQVRVRTVHTDAEILQWFQRLRTLHESRILARELGLPREQWTELREEEDARGRKVQRRVERHVHTREVPVLAGDAQARLLRLPPPGEGNGGLEVVGIPLPGPGYHVVEIESPRLGAALLAAPQPMYVRTGVLVTNLGVHVKRGREDSLVWVTSLDRGRPVAGAQVAVSDCRGQPLWQGRTDAQGLARIAQVLPVRGAPCPGGDALFVSARHTDAKGVADLGFAFTDWDRGIEPWRFHVPVSADAQPDFSAHTVFDRTLVRAGETVSMKHFLRRQTARGLAAVPTAQLPDRMRLVHEGSGEEVVVPLTWPTDARSAVASWKVPEAAKLGVWRVVLERSPPPATTTGPAAGSAQGPAQRPAQAPAQGPAPGQAPSQTLSWLSGTFRVEEFRVPLVQARLSTPTPVLVAPKVLPLDVQLQHLGGGGVANAPLRTTALLRPRGVAFPGYEEFRFEPPAAVREGVAPVEAFDPEAPPQEAAGRVVADRLTATTSAAGAARVTLEKLPAVDRASEVLAEVSFADPNGEVQAVALTVPVWPSAVVLGVQARAWTGSRGEAEYRVAALDTRGRPLRGQAVEVRGRQVEVTSTRKRLVGGFYAWENRTRLRELGVLCSGRTDERGLLLCRSKLEVAGEVQLVASARDAAGHPVQAAASVWATQQGELWFAQDDDDRIDVLPERRRVEPGETARLQVRMPFREATALVAVEREGVIDTRVVTLRGRDPTIELPVAREWGPNVYVSVLAVRGRLREVPWYSFFTWGWREPVQWARSYWAEGREYRPPTAFVDLSRPAFKLGVAPLEVGLAAHTLRVEVSPDKSSYGVREKARVKLRVTQDGQPLAGTEVALAAVDEGLLALQDNASWQLLEAMLRPRAWGVQTSTLQGEIIGRRHYGRKAVPAGGGGGRGGTRELFDTLLLWNPRVALDARGEATVEVPLNDSLTAFRVVAVADAGVQTFGTGSATLRVTQDLQLLPGLPPLVREGDRFGAMMTLRNTTTRAMTVRATLRGRPSAGPAIELPAQERKLEPGGAAELTWQVEVPAQASSIAWEGAADELGREPNAGDSARDRLRLTQVVVPAVPVRTLQATVAALDAPLTWPVQPPAGALADAGVVRGGLQVSLQPRLGGALPGLRRWFEAYPYTCLEQRASRAVGLQDGAQWAAVVQTLPAHLDADGLASHFPPGPQDGPRGSDRLTAYLLAASQASGFELPEALRTRMLAGLTAFVEGRLERRAWAPRPDLDVRKLAALEALARHGRAQPRMLGSIALAPAQWPTSALIDWLSILRQLDTVPDRARRLDEAQQLLRARLAYSGTTLRFSTEASDHWWWLMEGADANAARLILAVLDDPAWRAELPRLVTGHLGRQQRGAWSTTVANAWSVVALERFAARFESTPVRGRTSATTGAVAGPAASPGASLPAPAGGPLLASASASLDWARQPDGGSLALPWTAGPGTLRVTHEGSGRPWVTVQARAAVPTTQPVQAGYTLARTLVPVSQRELGRWSRGDVVRVRVELQAAADMSWVVLADPVPAGATILGSGLGRDAVATAALAAGSSGEPAESASRALVAFDERGFESFRRYFEFLPRGRHVVEYTVRLNQPGRFGLPPTRAEAMYAPEVHGEVPNASLEVLP